MKVMKFGGTSVGKPERMFEIVKLITKEEESKIVVLSALSGTTNALTEISLSLSKGDRMAARQLIDSLEQHYQNFISQLGVDADTGMANLADVIALAADQTDALLFAKAHFPQADRDFRRGGKVLDAHGHAGAHVAQWTQKRLRTMLIWDV